MPRTTWRVGLSPGQIEYVEKAIDLQGKRGQASKGYYVRVDGSTLPKPRKVVLVYRSPDGREKHTTDISHL